MMIMIKTTMIGMVVVIMMINTDNDSNGGSDDVDDDYSVESHSFSFVLFCRKVASFKGSSFHWNQPESGAGKPPVMEDSLVVFVTYPKHLSSEG